ncbi:MAG: hypothetical protein ACI4JR_08460, partial [Acutalibacteraceae bacterium]
NCGAKNKKPIFKRAWFWILIVVIVLFAIIIGSSDGDDNGGTGTAVERSDTSNNTAAKSSYNVGETYQNNYIKITFTDADTNFKNYNKYATVPSGYKVIMAEFDFENLSSHDEVASAYDFDCYADDESCENFWSVTDSGFTDTLSTGKKAIGRHVYFLVPVNAEKIVIEYELNSFDSSRIEFVVQ